MKVRRLPSRFLVVCALITAGCGGDSLGGSSPSISITASVPSLSYGQPVTLNWSSHGVTSIASANFAVSSSMTSGSLTDTPTIPTTYTITGKGNDGSNVSASVTVSVTKGSKKILYLADATQAGINQVTEFLQGLSTQSVQVSLALPPVFSADVVVISETASVSTSDVAALKSFLNGGGGVVLVQNATRKLATGDKNNSNISAIGSWFGGVTFSDNFTTFGAKVVSDSVPGFPLGACILGQSVTGVGVRPVSGSAISLTTQDIDNCYKAFAYAPSTGGKVAYVSDTPISTDAKSTALRNLFLTEVRWASGE